MVVTEAIWLGGSYLSLLALGVLGCCCGGSQQQQQQILNIGDDSKPKRICPKCGIENPREAKHCGDCGFAFKTGGENTDG